MTRWRHALAGALVVWFLLLGAPAARMSLAVPTAVAGDSAAATTAALDSAAAILLQHHLQPVDREALMRRALHGMADSLDRYTRYFEPDAWRDFHAGLESQFGGIGVVLGIDDSTRLARIERVFAGGAAAAAGLRPGDLVLTLDDASTRGWDIDRIIDAVRGVIGTKVRVSVRHPGASREETLTLTRAQVVTPSVRGVRRDRAGRWDYRYASQPRLAYVRIARMASDTAEGMRAALEAVRAQRAQGLILDLRANPGGLLSAAVGVADLFLDDGPIVTAHDRGDGDTTIVATPGHLASLPVVALVDTNTASSAEVLAACLQDRHVAVIAGTHSFGKGFVGHLYGLGAAGGLMVTTGTWLRPSGASIDRSFAPAGSTAWGVSPDAGMELRAPEDEYAAWLDADVRLATPASVGAPGEGAADDAALPKDSVLERAADLLRARLQH